MRRTKAEAGETRETILDSAETVFLEHGVNQSTLNQIAEHAGVTRGAIYFHFKDKIGLYQEVVERVRLPQDDLLTKAVHCENSNPLDIALDAGIFCLENFAGDPRKQRVFTIITQRCEYVGEMAQVLERLRDLNDEVHEMLLRLTTLARKRGVLSIAWRPDIAARALQSTMTGLLFEWMRLEKSFDLVAAGTMTMTAIVDSLRKKEIRVETPAVKAKKLLVVS
ncbi:TetR family transcriptional regulator [Phyllobacterium myrsinacearum]|uniref:AcrR family transcriptional regulator n=1 Tax=Phyllobacterium myrsinacearum TaxID=28101 RepID=A0A839EUL3_9HYPH|nr:TetR family transcriptional regulator [Phyllobacterium myrsinacearum]MBA8881016.1 AcrR family transcriptional regulator [Phyllobacterium myrsinacearum]